MQNVIAKGLATGLMLILNFPVTAAVSPETQRLLNTPLDDLSPLATITGSASLPLDCLLTPSMEVALASPVVGVIRTVNVKRGDLVKQGDVIVELYDEVERASLQLNTAQAEYGARTIERNRALYERKLISEQEKEEIEINNRVFALEAAQTQALVEQKQIRTPVSGIVTERFLDPGEYAGDKPILTIARLDPLYVEVVLPVELYGSIKKGMRSKIELAPPVGGSYEAKVEIVDRVLDAASGTFRVRLNLPNPKNRIPAGLKCHIKL